MSSYQPEWDTRWQEAWADERVFVACDERRGPKYYVLPMFPSPSSPDLHVGHAIGYVASDVVARYKRLRGFEVLFPSGWDAFGLGVQSQAREQRMDPKSFALNNATSLRKQLVRIGISIDWSRELNTASPEYYRWTQWLFLRLQEHGLVYRSTVYVNWCPQLQKVLANEEVQDGKSKTGGQPIYRRPVEHWMVRTTAFADRLLADLDGVDYPESVKAMQAYRIGRREGLDVRFRIKGTDEWLVAFVDQPELLYGATFCLLAPEHPLVPVITAEERRKGVQRYAARSLSKSDVARTSPKAERTAVFTGAMAENPLTGETIPVWVSDKILPTSETGARACVPAHDGWSDDYGFVDSKLMRNVIADGADGETLINSGSLSGMTRLAARARIAELLQERGLAEIAVRYRMRDWVFSREDRWGEPVPASCQVTATGSRGASAELPSLESAVLPALASSSWYYLRFTDPKNASALCSFDLAKTWMPVDLYVGGIEHGVGHLLYARFIAKFLYDIGVCPVLEPFARLVTTGALRGSDNRKMSKRRNNGVNVLTILQEFGADVLRLHSLAKGPIGASRKWDYTGLKGMRRFLDRVWALCVDENGTVADSIHEVEESPELANYVRDAYDAIESATESLEFHEAIDRLKQLLHRLEREDPRPMNSVEEFLRLLAPYAPHISEELWSRLGRDSFISLSTIPSGPPKVGGRNGPQ